MKIYTTSFCNHGHDLSTGKPVAHECYILDPSKLRLEHEGRIDEVQGGMPIEPRRTHRGVAR